MTRSRNDGSRKRGLELNNGKALDGMVHCAKNKRASRKIERARIKRQRVDE